MPTPVSFYPWRRCRSWGRLTANRRLELTGEVAGSALGSDVTFSTWRLAWDWHHELGASLILYGMVRLDVTRRLDRSRWRVGGSLARFDFD